MAPHPPFSVHRTVAEDIPPILALLAATSFFKAHEISVAQDVLNDAIHSLNDYFSFTAYKNDSPVGWICFGPTPCTDNTFDVYWIAVAPDYHRFGIGSYLLSYAEARISTVDGRLIVIETAGNERYASTRAFYEKIGYVATATVPDYYAQDDAKIIYVKYLCPHEKITPVRTQHT